MATEPRPPEPSGPTGPAGPTISTHVLDTERGAPAVGVHVTLWRIGDDGRAIRMTQALTDDDGRVLDLVGRPLAIGVYRLEFNFGGGDSGGGGGDGATGRMAPARDGFFRRMTVDLRIDDVGRSYHVPLLLSPYSMTTYRGS